LNIITHRSFGADCVFLPPYSPDFNPIEKLFGTLKQWFHAEAEWVEKTPAHAAIATGLASVAPTAFRNWALFEPDLYQDYP
jgi:hypothetical protein